jgi:hypothetical protein
LVLLILAVVWAVVLVPPWLRSRSEHRPADSISSFREQLSVLQRSGSTSGSIAPRASRAYNVAPVEYAPLRPSSAEIRRRRRDVLFTLIAAAGLTFGLAVFIGGPVILLHLVVDVLLVTYVALLARAERMAAERRMKVRYLPRQASAPEPALLYRRSGS